MTEQTPAEERSAQNALDDAVAAFYAANPDAYGGQLLTGYVLIAAHASIEPCGHDVTQYSHTVMGGTMPWHSIIGMVEMARMRMRADITSGGDE